MMENRTSSRYFVIFIGIICFLTNFSQMPYFVEAGRTRYISLSVWVLALIVCFKKNNFLQLLKIKGLIYLGLFFAGYYVVVKFFIPDYANSALPYNIFLSLFIAIVGSMVGVWLDSFDFKVLYNMYIWSAMLVCVNVYTNYIRGRSLYGVTYLYASKNSVSQILLTAWMLILLFKISESGIIKKVVYGGFFAMLTYVLIALKSRATLIGIPIILIWVLMHGKTNRKIRNVIIVLLLGLLFVLITNGQLVDFLLNEVIYGGRNVQDLNSISSGRSTEWEMFLSDWADSWIFGVGRCKRESLILTALLEFGIFGGVPVLMTAIYPFVWGIRKLQKSGSVYVLFTGMALVYAVNGVFEQLAPFGPGVKCYFLWFMLGILSTANDFELTEAERDWQESI